MLPAARRGARAAASAVRPNSRAASAAACRGLWQRRTTCHGALPRPTHAHKPLGHGAWRRAPPSRGAAGSAGSGPGSGTGKGKGSSRDDGPAAAAAGPETGGGGLEEFIRVSSPRPGVADATPPSLPSTVEETSRQMVSAACCTSR